MINIRKFFNFYSILAILFFNVSSNAIAQDYSVSLEELQSSVKVKNKTVKEENINISLPENFNSIDYSELENNQSPLSEENIVLPPLFTDLSLEKQETITEDPIKGNVSRTNEPFKLWDAVKGKKDKDSLLLGMWSKHLSSKDYRETHNLAAFQYKGFILGTFTNSHDDQVYFAGIARNIARKKFGEHTIVDLGYKIAPMYGYKKGIPEIGGFSILPVLCMDTSYRNVGLSVNLYPSMAFSFNTYINLDMFTKKQKPTE